MYEIWGGHAIPVGAQKSLCGRIAASLPDKPGQEILCAACRAKDEEHDPPEPPPEKLTELTMPEDPDPAVDLLLRHGTLPCLCDRCWPRDSFRDLPPEDFALAKRLDNERVARQGF